MPIKGLQGLHFKPRSRSTPRPAQAPRHARQVAAILAQVTKCSPPLGHLAGRLRAIGAADAVFGFNGRMACDEASGQSAQRGRADSCVSLNDKAAQQTCRQAREQQLHLVVAHTLLAASLIGTGQTKEALSIFDHALSLCSNYMAASCLKSLMLFPQTNLPAALTACDRAIARNHKSLAAHHTRSGRLLLQDRLVEAKTALHRAIMLSPCSPILKVQLGRLNLRQNQGRLALNCFNEAISLWSDFGEAYLLRGIALEQLHDLPTALASLDRAIELGPHLRGLHYYRARILTAQDKLPMAKQAVDRALALNENDPAAHFLRSLILGKLKDIPLALAACKRALELRPDDPLARQHQNSLLASQNN